jgi:hypothetical protein
VASDNGWLVRQPEAAAATFKPSTKLQHGYAIDKHDHGLEKRLQP